jgi:hypothetical protein
MRTTLAQPNSHRLYRAVTSRSHPACRLARNNLAVTASKPGSHNPPLHRREFGWFTPVWFQGSETWPRLESCNTTPALAQFVRAYRPFLHATEINGYRSHAENKVVIALGLDWDMPVLAGGDRHGRAPNARPRGARRDCARCLAGREALGRAQRIAR